VPNPKLTADIVADLEKGLRRSQFKIPVGISHRHFHITQEHWTALFGPGTEPTMHRQLRQPGFWAAKEKVDMEGPKGRINGVRLVAPYRAHTQSEVSRSDARVLGIDPPVRGSGNLKGAAPIRFIGPKGSLELREAVIIS